MNEGLSSEWDLSGHIHSPPNEPGTGDSGYIASGGGTGTMRGEWDRSSEVSLACVSGCCRTVRTYVVCMYLHSNSI